MFDPEKVERFYPDNNGNMERTDTALINYVDGEDYDQLLELYREMEQSRDAYANAMQYPDS